MQVNVGTVDNFEILPTPVLDESAPEGYRMEQRLQVSLKSRRRRAPTHRRVPPRRWV